MFYAILFNENLVHWFLDYLFKRISNVTDGMEI